MNCHTCKKQLEKDDLKCGLSIERSDGRAEQHFECGHCHTKKWNERYLEDLKIVANTCKTEAQLKAAFEASHFVQRWKRTKNPLLGDAVKIYNARLRCF